MRRSLSRNRGIGNTPRAARSPRAEGTSRVHLPRSLLHDVEDFFQTDLSAVQFYETAWVRRLGARALACGDRVCFDRSRFNPDTAPGRRLIIHELAHVVQQRWYRAGRLSWRGTALVDDPILEAEAEAAAKRFLQGRSAPRGCRRASAQTDESGAVIQCQKWGLVGRSWLKVPPSDYANSFADQSSWNEAKGEVQEGKATEYRGIFALYNPTWDGRGKLSQNIARNRESKPPDSVKVVKYNSTATENETYDTRADAWVRVFEIVNTLFSPAAVLPNSAQYVYCIRGAYAANQQITDTEGQQAEVTAVGGSILASDRLIWVRYKDGNTPDAGGVGNYFDYGAGAQRQGKNLLIVEHTEDADASLEVSTSTKASGYNLSGTAAMTMVKHFHIVCYDAGDQQYIPVDQRDGAFSLAPSPGVRIRESALLTSRKGYESWGDDLPAHHIYYLA